MIMFTSPRRIRLHAILVKYLKIKEKGTKRDFYDIEPQ